MARNRHGTLLLVGDRGILITGPSGAGKTRLALSLIRHCIASGRFARLVSDDQIFLETRGGRLIGRGAPEIGGLAEARGFGPAPIAYEPAAVIDLLVRLLPAGTAPRYQEGDTEQLEGVELPCLRLEERDAEGAVLAIAAWVSLPPFG